MHGRALLPARERVSVVRCHRTHARFKLEDDLAAARNLNHQLRDDEAAAQRLLQQRQDDLQRTCRCDQQAVLACTPTSQPHALQAPRGS